jgi:hypothetical protein
MNRDFRVLTLSDVEQAAQVIPQAFVDDPMLVLVSARCSGLHGAAPTPLPWPTGEKGSHNQRADGGKEGEPIRILKSVYARVAGNLERG